MTRPEPDRSARTVVCRIIDGPITRTREAEAIANATDPAMRLERGGSVGAVVRFDGVVRLMEPDTEGRARALEALEYETYEPMAQRELNSLALAVADEHGLMSVVVLHSRGRVRPGEVSMVVRIASGHRAEALAGLASLIDRLKRDAPIWKRPIWSVAPEE